MESWTYLFAISIGMTSLLGCGNGSDSAIKQRATQSDDDQRKQAPITSKTDLDRIKDVHTIAELVEQFQKKAGHYPYEEAFLNPEPGYVAVPASVNITLQDLPEKYRFPPPGVSGTIYPYNDFIDYLQEVLGNDIELPCDSEQAPRFYQYQFDGKHYYVSAVLLQPTEQTRKLAPGWHKYQVSSTSVPDKKILKYSDIE